MDLVERFINYTKFDAHSRVKTQKVCQARQNSWNLPST